MPTRFTRFSAIAVVFALTPACLFAQSIALPRGLEDQLKKESSERLAAEALQLGDAARGAIVFHQPYMTCTQCHTAGDKGKPLGPDLARPDKQLPDSHFVESLLQPSKVIKDGFQSLIIATSDGANRTGLVVEELADSIVIRDVGTDGQQLKLSRDDIQRIRPNDQSIMPTGLVNQLASR